VVLWEVYSCGQVPYADLTAIETLKAVGAGRRLNKPNMDMPTAAFDLMRACMLRDPKARPSTMAAASDRLLELCQEQEQETEL
jgi:hypothetical protein